MTRATTPQLTLFPSTVGTPHLDVRPAVRDAIDGTPDRLRGSFARAFVARAIERYWERLHRRRGRVLQEPPEPIRALRSSAEPAAVALGDSASQLASDHAAYLIGSAYAAALPMEVRAANGVFYTPPPLVDRLIANVEAAGADWSKAHVLDPACGGGAFLAPIAARMCDALKKCDRRVVARNVSARLKGYEIDDFAAWISRVFLDATLYEKLGGSTIDVGDLIEVRNSLDTAHASPSFDVVIGNPPYGKVTLASADRETFKRSLFGHANLYGLFLDLAVRHARERAVIGFVTPTSFLGGEYFKRLRGLLAAEANPVTLDLVHERAGVFDGVLQETLLTVCRRGEQDRAPRLHFIDGDEVQIRAQSAGEVQLPDDACAPWILPRAASEVTFSRHLRAHRTTLRDWGYRVSTGPLVWNRHKGQLHATARAGSAPLIWAEAVASDGTFEFRAARRNHLPYFEPQHGDDWLLVREPCVLLQRTTSKEQPRRLVAAVLPEKFIAEHGAVVVENHLNMVVRERDDAVDPATLAAFLNSSAADRAFRCISGSVAVSAYELESMPLPHRSRLAPFEEAIQRRATRVELDEICDSLYAS